MIPLGSPGTLIEYNFMRFVITHMPDKISTRQYIQDLQQYNTRKLLNVNEDTYSTEIFNVVGITVTQLAYPDGTFPTTDIIEQWLVIIRKHFLMFPNTAIAIHDRSGLGRAPLLVAIALIENGMKTQEAIDLIRMKRRGAFNALQLEELLKYKPNNRLMEKEKSKILTRLCSKGISGSSSNS